MTRDGTRGLLQSTVLAAFDAAFQFKKVMQQVREN
jgi:hypothetical protein